MSERTVKASLALPAYLLTFLAGANVWLFVDTGHGSNAAAAVVTALCAINGFIGAWSQR